jgi:disulfide bond formation protein DsbB
MHTLIDTIIGYGTVILQFFAGITLLLIIFKNYVPTPLPEFIREKGICLGFVVALLAVVGSLYYSEIRLLPPCTFCWWQRIFLYPQVIVFGVAWYTKQYQSARITSLILSSVGVVIAIIHVLAQMGIRSTGLPCAVNGVSCTSIDLILLGYITIPIMSLTLYITMIIIQGYGIINKKQ